MGYFDGLTDASFKTDSQGQDLFFPWGIFGSGFIIESEVQKNQVRNFIKKTYIMTFFTIVIIQVFVGLWLNLVLLPIYCIWYYRYIYKLTQNLQRSNEKLKPSESYKNSAQSHNLSTLVLFEFISLGFVAVGLWLPTTGKESFISYIGVGFFGFCAIVFVYMIIAKIKSKSK